MSYNKPLSYSGMSLWKQCPRRWEWTYIEGNREPPGPAAMRGTLIHQMLEDYYNGKTAYPSGNSVLGPWQSTLEELVHFSPIAEGELAVDSGFVPTSFSDPLAFLRGAVDLRYSTDEACNILDWKTGKIYESHVDQGALYAAITPLTDIKVVRFYYLDQPLHTVEWRYTLEQQLEQRDRWAEQANIIRAATEYPAVPGDHCNWCPLSWRKGGECKRAR